MGSMVGAGSSTVGFAAAVVSKEAESAAEHVRHLSRSVGAVHLKHISLLQKEQIAFAHLPHSQHGGGWRGVVGGLAVPTGVALRRRDLCESR